MPSFRGPAWCGLILLAGTLASPVHAALAPRPPAPHTQALLSRSDAWTRETLVRIGSVECELSGWALPCAKNRRWFTRGVGERRIDPDAHPGWSRAYAYVLTSQGRGVDGELRIGDAVAFS